MLVPYDIPSILPVDHEKINRGLLFLCSALVVTVGDSDTATLIWTSAPQTQTQNGNLSYAIAPDNGRVTINDSTGIVAITSNALAADSGSYTVTATGTNNYTGTQAQFNFPSGIAIDSNNENLYVADNRNHRIRKIVIGITLE